MGLRLHAPSSGHDVENPKTHLTYGFATQVVILNDEGRSRRSIAAHDVGRVMNPTLLEGQIGLDPHGLGYALTEDFVVEGGHIQTDTIKSLGVLRAHQMPEIELIFIEEPDPEMAVRRPRRRRDRSRADGAGRGGRAGGV